jgi:hypothetical protein
MSPPVVRETPTGSRFAATAMVLGAMLLLGTQAQALIAHVDDQEMAALSDEVVTCKVTGKEVVEQQVPGMKYLMTNVTLQVSDAVKASINKNSAISLSSPGGQKGGILTTVSDFPEFRVGQEVMLYVKYNHDKGIYTIVGGNRGTMEIFTDSTGKKYVMPSSVEAAEALKAAAAKVAQKSGDQNAKAQAAEPLKIPLEEYQQYLRNIVNQQKKK